MRSFFSSTPLAILLGANTSFATPPRAIVQSPPALVAQHGDGDDDRPEPHPELRGPRRMRRAGIALTATGAGLAGLGCLMIASWSGPSHGDEAGPMRGMMTLFGVVAASTGVVSLSVGVPLWIAGASEIDRQTPAWRRSSGIYTLGLRRDF